MSRHSMPAEVLPDRRPAFLSGLMKEVGELLGSHKVNTSANHPQTDGLVERFNNTLTTMLAKTVGLGGHDWDQRFLYVLFAYRASAQQSTQESPFHLLYYRDPRLPTEAALSALQSRVHVDLREYGQELTEQLSTAWELARTCVPKAQRRQKRCADRQARPPNFVVLGNMSIPVPACREGWESVQAGEALPWPFSCRVPSEDG